MVCALVRGSTQDIKGGEEVHKLLIFMRFHRVFLGNQHEIWPKQHNGKVSYFDFQYRKEHGFPPFQCKYCNFGSDGTVYGDYNAAKNLANPDFVKIAQKNIPKAVRDKYLEEARVA